MSQKIYKMFRTKSAREAWYQLSEEEQKELLAKVNNALEQVGGKRIVMCAATWANDSLIGFGVEEFPDIDAIQRHMQLLMELNLFRYFDSESTLGTEWQPF